MAGEGRREMTANGCRVSLWGNKDVLELDCKDEHILVNILKTTELYIL